MSDTTAPTLSTLPNAHMVVGTIIGPTVPVTLAWKGRDNLSGICRYRVHQKINAGSVASMVPARPTNTTVARSITPGTKVYHYSVQPVDCSDNTPGYIAGKSARIVMHQNANGGIKYRGVWHKLRSPGTSGGTITSTSKKNSSAALTFTGRQVAWVASKSSLRGKARVYIDGKADQNRRPPLQDAAPPPRGVHPRVDSRWHPLDPDRVPRHQGPAGRRYRRAARPALRSVGADRAAQLTWQLEVHVLIHQVVRADLGDAQLPEVLDHTGDQ